ncbi:MAG: c-type cytochrome domain-containing protein [Chitinophagales bacterium]
MKKIFFALTTAVVWMTASTLLHSCYYDSREELFGGNTCDTTNVTYSLNILPILEAQCYSCHSEANANAQGGGNNLEGYVNLSDFITPNDPENSLLYQSVAWIPGTSFMPKGGQKLSSCELAQIRTWIVEGATNN